MGDNKFSVDLEDEVLTVLRTRFPESYDAIDVRREVASRLRKRADAEDAPLVISLTEGSFLVEENTEPSPPLKINIHHDLVVEVLDNLAERGKVECRRDGSFPTYRLKS